MRPGVALPLVLFVLSLGSALAVGGAYVTRSLASTAVASQRGVELQLLAEGAIAEAVSSARVEAWSSQPAGGTIVLSSTSAMDVEVRVWVTRLADSTFWIVGEAHYRSKPFMVNRLGLSAVMGDSLVRPIPKRGWVQLP